MKIFGVSIVTILLVLAVYMLGVMFPAPGRAVASKVGF